MKRKKTLLRCESDTKWRQDEGRKYLWINDTDDIQVMTFTNDVNKMLTCFWIKIFDGKDYVSNYLVYDREAIQKHPLDYAIELRDEFLNKKDGE